MVFSHAGGDREVAAQSKIQRHPSQFVKKKFTSFPDCESFAIFVKTVIMKPFLGYISDSKKRDEFLNAFLSDVKYLGQPRLLDFMLLSIFARK